MALLGLGALVLAMAAGAWISIRAGQPSSPVYGSTGAAAAALWTWDGGAYSVAPVVGAGPSSNDADLAYDPTRHVMVLWDHGCDRLVMGFTGGCASQVDRTWEWDGRRWSAPPSRSSPTEAGPGAMLTDRRLGRVVYVNGLGQAWSWTGAGWTPLPLPGAPQVPPRESGATAAAFAAGYDGLRDLLVYALPTATWLWDGSSWTVARSGIDPGDARADAHLVADREHGQLLYVGGSFTWTWDGSRWQARPQPAIARGTAGYDPVRRTVVLVQQDASACDRTACRTSTWTWAGNGWTQLRISRGPVLPLTRSAASLPPMAFDESREVMALFVSGT